MQLRRLVGLLAGATMLVVACGSSANDEADEARATFTSEYCELTAGYCCPKAGRGYTTTSCTRTLGASPGVTVDKAVADRCIAALRTAQSGPRFCIDIGGEDVRALCYGAYKLASASKKAGEACSLSTDCAPDPSGRVSCAVASLGGEGRVCQVEVHAHEGEDCKGIRNDVGQRQSTSIDITGVPRVGLCWESEGLYCPGESGDTRSCRRRAPFGGACDPSEFQPCATGTRCERESRTCILLLGLGADCSPDTTEACITEAHCEPNTQKCIENLPAGASCTVNLECGVSGFCNNGKCEDTSRLGEAFCAP